MTCTFFGHSDAPETLEPLLEQTLREHIENQTADRFYVGHNGNFDRMAERALKKLQERCPQKQAYTVLAYLPRPGESYLLPTIYPEGLEAVPPRFAIYARNRWMISQSGMCVTYVVRPFGGAAKFKERAKQKGLCMIELE